MPLPALPLPEYPWTTAYDALVAVLKEDADLKRVVRPRSWRAWDGVPEDFDNFTTADMPWIRLTPLPPSIALATEADYKVDFPVKVEFATAGTNVRDLMNFWGAVMQALRFDRPFRATTVGRYLREHGTVFHRVTGVGIDPKLIGGDFMSISTITMLLHVPS